jgi:hypothetical protein
MRSGGAWFPTSCPWVSGVTEALLRVRQTLCDWWCDLAGCFWNFWYFQVFALCITCLFSEWYKGTSPPLRTTDPKRFIRKWPPKVLGGHLVFGPYFGPYVCRGRCGPCWTLQDRCRPDNQFSRVDKVWPAHLSRRFRRTYFETMDSTCIGTGPRSFSFRFATITLERYGDGGAARDPIGSGILNCRAAFWKPARHPGHGVFALAPDTTVETGSWLELPAVHFTGG